MGVLGLLRAQALSNTNQSPQKWKQFKRKAFGVIDGVRYTTWQAQAHALSLGVTSADDRIRKRMLEDFAKHGLVDIATDYGIFLLAFTKRGLENMKVTLGGE